MTIQQFNEKMIVLAKLGAPHGLNGELKLYLLSETEDIFSYPTWWLRPKKTKEWRKLTDEQVHRLGSRLLIKLPDINTPEDAAQFVHAEIAVERSDLPDTEQDEYYWEDLIGLAVRNAEGTDFGKVKYLLDTGANDVLVAECCVDSKEYLIPFVGQYIIEVDLTQKKILVDWEKDYL